MSFLAIESYLNTFKFIEDLIKNPDYKLNILSINEDMSHIRGEIRCSNDVNNLNFIPFETDIIKLDDSLMFKTIYDVNGKISVEKDIFLVLQEKQRAQYYNRKSKFLIHILDNDIKHVYTTGKKYKLENGLNYNLGIVNMKNSEVIRILESLKKDIINMTSNISTYKNRS